MLTVKLFVCVVCMEINGDMTMNWTVERQWLMNDTDFCLIATGLLLLTVVTSGSNTHTDIIL